MYGEFSPMKMATEMKWKKWNTVKIKTIWTCAWSMNLYCKVMLGSGKDWRHDDIAPENTTLRSRGTSMPSSIFIGISLLKQHSVSCRFLLLSRLRSIFNASRRTKASCENKLRNCENLRRSSSSNIFDEDCAEQRHRWGTLNSPYLQFFQI